MLSSNSGEKIMNNTIEKLKYEFKKLKRKDGLKVYRIVQEVLV